MTDTLVILLTTYQDVLVKSGLFNVHLQEVTQRTESVMNNLGRLMGRQTSPKQSKRRIILSIVLFVVLYAVPAWADALSKKKKEM